MQKLNEGDSNILIKIDKTFFSLLRSIYIIFPYAKKIQQKCPAFL